MKIKYILIFLCLIGINASAIAQNPAEILCKILDKDTNYPVSYATVAFEGENNGVIADEEGDFRLPLQYKTQNKFIVISSIGFEKKRISLATLKSDTINIIYLKTKVEELQAVIITGTSGNTKSGSADSESAKAIIRNAIGKIPSNYPNEPHAYMAYYRDYQLVNNNYYNLNEGILENYDAGFGTNKLRYKDNVTALYSYGLNKDFYQDTLLLKTIYGKSKSVSDDNSARLGTDIQNELEILNIHNPIRNYDKNSFSFIYVFRNDFINNHLFKLSSVKYIGDVPLYEIEFVTRDNPTSKYMGAGKIYVSKSNYAIHKIEYSVFANKNYRSTRSQDDPFGNLTKKPKGILFEITVEYKVVGTKMFLNYMTFNNLFVVKKPNPFKVEDFLFNPKTKNFIITFNMPVDMETIKRKSNFRLRYKNKKLIVKDVKAMDDKTVKVKVVDWSAGLKDSIANIDSTNFAYKLKRIKNTFGTTINKITKISGYQFRELFTQEVFENKKPSPELIYVNKAMPISATKSNIPSFDIDKYWINSPLRRTKKTN